MNAEERASAMIDQATRRWASHQVDSAALDRVLAGAMEQARGEVPNTTYVRWAWLVLRAQVPIVLQRLLAASLLVMMLGAAVVMASGRGWSRDVFVLLAPLAAAGGSAILFRDGLGELGLVLPARPRLVLLARLVVVFAADLAAALLTSVAVAGRMHEALGALIGAWLGPMLLLATVSLLVSVVSGPGAGTTVALGLWFLRVLAGLDTPGGFVTPSVAARVDAAWATSPIVLVVALTLLAASVVAAPRRLAVTS
jgi:hypothetical protein